MNGRPLRTQSLRYRWHGELVTAKSNGDLALARPLLSLIRLMCVSRHCSV
jgi:hypothetical protein